MISNDMAPLKYRIYKGIGGKFGAAQFSFNQPFFYCSNDRKHKYYQGDIVRKANFSSQVKCTHEGCDGSLSPREGNIFLEMAVTTKPNAYDWDRKIQFCLSVKDVGEILTAMKKGITKTLTHDPGAGTQKKGNITKVLKWEVKDKSKGALLSLYEKKKGDEKGRNVMVPLSLDEVLTLGLLFEAVTPSMLAWT